LSSGPRTVTRDLLQILSNMPKPIGHGGL